MNLHFYEYDTGRVIAINIKAILEVKTAFTRNVPEFGLEYSTEISILTNKGFHSRYVVGKEAVIKSYIKGIAAKNGIGIRLNLLK